MKVYVVQCDGLRAILPPYNVKACELSSRVHAGGVATWTASHMARAIEGRDIGFLTVMAYRRSGNGHVEHEGATGRWQR